MRVFKAVNSRSRMTDKYLTTMYGEWKKIPEPENRHTHLPLLLDFGDGEVWTAQN